ncbi:MAG: 23S rRNA (uracil(1939)-C(5))-methyltransferase RlmD [Rikenellaceae bacterium]|nr:23S rRNA (uracil(1939)-C(5))-methyltransferase RlmD [Rikenellaceae bacterium]
MARKKNKYPLIEGLEITDVAAEGKSLGKYGDIVVFVPMTIPGDIVNVQVTNKRKSFMEGYVTEYIEFSPDRCEPLCSHYGICGGCKWQNMPYYKQLEYKQQQVYDQLTRIGKLELPEINDILGSEKTECYRNKLEFTFSCKRWMTKEEIATDGKINDPNALGFHIPGMFDKIVNIEHCWLQAEPSNKIRIAVHNFCLTNGYGYYDARQHAGYMRNMVIRTSTTGEVMVIVAFGYDDNDRQTALLEYIKNSFPEITSLMYVINEKKNDTIGDLDIRLYSGKDHIFEEMEGLRFKIGPKSFYQTNSEQAHRLYSVTRDFASLQGDEIVYDLYTGTGTIANFIARRCGKVIGVEYVPEAIEDAKNNFQINGIVNTEFFAGDMKDILTEEFINIHGKPDIIILDPPRAGIHQDVAETILNAAPEKIVYVSCNPATQARDAAILARDYKVAKVQPVDMFPHTHHVENVILMERK